MNRSWRGKSASERRLAVDRPSRDGYRRPMRIRVTVALAALTALATFAPATHAQSPQPFGPWGGENPFNCQLQDVGKGTDFPDPGADPFCVEFDKTSQNVTDFGIGDFLLNEPARTAAAVNKCFYYQRDHWTGSIVQGKQPELWHWDGNYYFDKAEGTGGVSVHNFRIGGKPADAYDYVPPAFKPYFYPGGGGGGRVLLETNPDPLCIAKVDTPKERRRVYRANSARPHCIPPRGTIHRRRVAGIRLGMKRPAVISRLGAPRKRAHGVDRWCVVGKANLRVAYAGHAHRTALIRTTSRGHTVRRVGPGARAARAKRVLALQRRFRLGRTMVFAAKSHRGARLLAGIATGRVRWLALADGKLERRHVRAALRRAR
jgi:hypothetical protein